jgi:nicotinate-nucleotide adenylyltransferase
MHMPPKASIHQRLKMVALGIREVSGFALCDWEAKEEGVHYTIDTVRKLTQDPSLQVHLLLGEDQANSLPQWKEAEELIRLAPPIVGVREGAEGDTPFSKVKIPLYEISSTAVRQRLLQQKYCGHLIPTLVLDYIQQHRLYS